MLVRVIVVLAGLELYLSEWFMGRRLGGTCTSNRLLGVEVVVVKFVCCVWCWLVAAVYGGLGSFLSDICRLCICRSCVEGISRLLRRAGWRLARSPLLKRVGC